MTVKMMMLYAAAAARSATTAVRLVQSLLTRMLMRQVECCQAVKPCSTVMRYSCSHSQLMMIRMLRLHATVTSRYCLHIDRKMMNVGLSVEYSHHFCYSDTKTGISNTLKFEYFYAAMLSIEPQLNFSV